MPQTAKRRRRLFETLKQAKYHAFGTTKATFQKTLDEVRSIVRERLRDHDVEVFLFGSWAAGRPTRTSDVDIGVLPARDLPSGVLARLRQALAESHVPYPVEVVDLRTVDPSFRRKVMREGIRWNA